MIDDPHDAPPDPGRQQAAVADGILMYIKSLSILCGETFITHGEHQDLIDQMDDAGKRWLLAKETLRDLDFEP